MTFAFVVAPCNRPCVSLRPIACSLVGLAALGAAGCSDESGPSGSSKPGTVTVQISGEDIATGGIAFPDGSEVVIVDGWALHFDHVLVTVGRAWLARDPNRNPGDPSDFGEEVAAAEGPWAVDLARDGDVLAAGGEGTAIHLADIEAESDGASLSTDQPYAFSFSFVAADDAASRINLDDEASALYEEAIAKGYAVYYVGTATYVGASSCETSGPDYDFDSIATTIPFRLGFDSPTEYLNCQNQENQGNPFEGEEYARGITIQGNEASLGQITVHLEHPFFSDVQHDPTLYFDQLAARTVGKAEPELTMEDLRGVDLTAFTDGEGAPLPWRVCTDASLPFGEPRAFEVGSIAVGSDLDPAHGLRDYRDYVKYVQSTQGHLNGGDGLCFIRRRYPSPR